MKKKDFIIPFKYEDRRPIIINGLLYIPDNYFLHSQADIEILFNNTNPIFLEYCSGNGEWIIEKAKKFININWIAVEYSFDRARKIFVKKHNENIENLFIVFGEALIFTKCYLKDSFIDHVFINFPDPWPKTKHKKNRLVQNPFVIEVFRVLKENSFIEIATDHEKYKDQIVLEFLSTNYFRSFYKKPFFINELEEYGSSYFEKLYKKMNKQINYMKFKKIVSG